LQSHRAIVHFPCTLKKAVLHENPIFVHFF